MQKWVLKLRLARLLMWTSVLWNTVRYLDFYIFTHCAMFTRVCLIISIDRTLFSVPFYTDSFIHSFYAIESEKISQQIIQGGPKMVQLKGIVHEKWNGGIGWNLRISGVERYLSRKIDINMCQNCIRKFIYIQFSV